jgi:drug/metabolite transporter (DMT)-like permease
MLALMLVLIWGSNYSVLKAAMAHIGAQGVIFLRYLITPACAAAVLLWRHGLCWPRLERVDWLPLTGLALLGHVAHVTVMTHAMDLSTPFSSALISACGPVFTLLIVRAIWKHRVAPVQALGVVLALLGVLVFVSDKITGPKAQSLGDLLLLAGTVLFSSHTIAAGGMIRRHGSLVVLAYTTFLATLPLLLINTPGAMQVAWSGLSPGMWLALTWSLAIASFFGWLIWGWLNEELGVPRCAPLLYLLPPVAGLISWFALGESFGPIKVAGAALAILGVAAAQFGAASARAD